MSSKVLNVIMAGVMMLPTVFVGCSDKGSPTRENAVSESAGWAVGMESLVPETLLSTQLPGCRVDISSYDIDTTDRSVTFGLNVWFDEDSPARRVLRISVADDALRRPGYRATLSDQGESLLWEFEGRIDPDYENHSWLTERSSADVLTIEQSKTNEAFVETYTLNGRQQEFSFPTGDIGKIERLRDDCFSNGYRPPDDYSTYSETDREIVETFVEFESFYEWDNSLHNNPEGFLVAEFLTSEDVAVWLADELGLDIPFLRPWHTLCDLAGIVAGVKCPYGANPACYLALAALAICIIIYYF